MKIEKFSFLLSSESTFDVVKGTNKRGQYKMKIKKFSFLLSSESTFDVVRGTNKRGQYKMKIEKFGNNIEVDLKRFAGV